MADGSRITGFEGVGGTGFDGSPGLEGRWRGAGATAHMVAWLGAGLDAGAANHAGERPATIALGFDLGALAPPDGFVIRGDAGGDQAGSSVSDAGDVNGDGFGDVIVGAPAGADGGERAGEAYVIFGKASRFGTIDLTNLAPAEGFIVQGDAAYDAAGGSVSSVGDINGDGFDDLIIGAHHGDDGGASAGEAYVIFGKASGFGAPDAAGRRVIDLTGLAAADGFVIQGDAEGDLAGFSVSSAGDVDGDGFDDLVVGAPYGDDGGNIAGEAYVIFGKASGLGPVDLTGLASRPADGFIIQGDAVYDQAGISVSSAGDVNGDGFGDVIVGASTGDDGGSNTGEAYVIFGKASGFGTIDLTGLASRPDDGFIIQGDGEGDSAGFSVSSAGDVNGDGFDDLIVGAPNADDGGAYSGAAYVIFGKEKEFETIDLTSFDPADPDYDPAAGFIIQGDAEYDTAGISVSGAGDFNGDGFDDLIVGAPFGDDGGYNAGEAYLIYGKAAGFGTIDLTGLASRPEEGFVIEGTEQDNAGFSVSSAGDVNGDGFDDLIVGAPQGAGGGSITGEAYVIFGFGPGTPTILGGGAADSLVGGARDELLKGKAGDDTLQGNGGGDTLDGGSGADWADYLSATAKVRADLLSPAANTGDAAGDSYVSIENLRGGAKDDRLLGDDLANGLVGLAGDDLLSGRGGKDTLAGGKGHDTLDGGGGGDRFVLASTNVDDADRIEDFGGNDRITLDGDAFGLPEGALAPGRFALGSAQDANDRLVYKTATGKLYFDPDGTGAQAQVLIATLTGAPALSAGEFVVI